MYIRRKVYSSYVDENGEERLFSTNEVISEEEYCQRIFAEAEEEEKPKKGTLRKIGKGVAIGGALTGIGGGIAENVIADNTLKKMAAKKGLEKIGWGLASGLKGEGAHNAIKVAERSFLKNKGFKTVKCLDNLGAGAALAGTGAYLAGRYIDHRRNKTNKE